MAKRANSKLKKSRSKKTAKRLAVKHARMSKRAASKTKKR